jgi:hypothetical protein
MRSMMFYKFTRQNGRLVKDVTPMSLADKVKVMFASALGLFIAVLWFFGGFIGAIVAAFKGNLVMLVLSIFIPGVGAIYTVWSILAGIF